jgi:hypothetical protein
MPPIEEDANMLFIVLIVGAVLGVIVWLLLAWCF